MNRARGGDGIPVELFQILKDDAMKVLCSICHRILKIQQWPQDCCCYCCYVTSVVSDSVRPHRRQPTKLHRPWDSPGKNTGVSCPFLLQRMKLKSESEVAQSCLTLRDPMNGCLPGSSVHGIFQARVLEWVAIAFSPQPPQSMRNKFFAVYKLSITVYNILLQKPEGTEPANVNCGLWVNLRCPEGSSLVRNVPLWRGMLTAGEVEHVWKEGLFGNSVLSTQFCYQLRTALKNKVY